MPYSGVLSAENENSKSWDHTRKVPGTFLLRSAYTSQPQTGCPTLLPIDIPFLFRSMSFALVRQSSISYVGVAVVFTCFEVGKKTERRARRDETSAIRLSYNPQKGWSERVNAFRSIFPPRVVIFLIYLR
jgi:hypothetical protein